MLKLFNKKKNLLRYPADSTELPITSVAEVVNQLAV